MLVDAEICIAILPRKLAIVQLSYVYTARGRERQILVDEKPGEENPLFFTVL
jgi:hypothetical protein